MIYVIKPMSFLEFGEAAERYAENDERKRLSKQNKCSQLNPSPSGSGHNEKKPIVVKELQKIYDEVQREKFRK